ncbi:MAG: HNH endonuclease [Planctomycetes bacterium]|nr:HNH endonuclease [Planctomycetota bacterium]
MNDPLRELVFQRAAGNCEYCRVSQQFDPITFELDHIIARKHRGQTVSGNLALACFSCNNFKGPNVSGVDPESGKVEPLYHPRNDSWSEHFEWHGATLVGKTPCGRATVEVLEINVPYRVIFRRELIEEGVFPPA